MQHINKVEPIIEVINKIGELAAENPYIQTMTAFMMAGYLVTIGLGLIKGWLEDKYGFGSIIEKEKTKDHLDEIDNFNEYVSEDESEDHLDEINNFDDLDEIEEEYLIELKCKNCKGHLEIKNNYFQCKYCDTKYIRKE